MTNSKLSPEAAYLLELLIEANGGYLPRLAIVNTLQDLALEGKVTPHLTHQGTYLNNPVQGYILTARGTKP